MPGAETGAKLLPIILGAIAPLVKSIREMAERPRRLRIRNEMNRRRNPPRRVSPISQRLRAGLWLQYHRATRSGEFDAIPFDDFHATGLREALWPEAVKYILLDRGGGQEVSAEHALKIAVERVWRCEAAWIERPRSHKLPRCAKALYVIDAIAEEICREYQVTGRDRRAADRRSAQAAVGDTGGQQLIDASLLLGAVACGVAAISGAVTSYIALKLQAALGAATIAADPVRAVFVSGAVLLACWWVMRRLARPK
ncbi:MAG: hypothetical protein JSU00_29600 [Acidobacteria bacterium]|nr:hypothetical protein [Acidobacteriota bacterium]